MADQLAEVEAIVSDRSGVTFESTLVPLELSGQLLHCTRRVFFDKAGSDSNPRVEELETTFPARPSSRSAGSIASLAEAGASCPGVRMHLLVGHACHVFCCTQSVSDESATDESWGKWYGGVPGRGWYAPGSGEPIPESLDGDQGLHGTRIRFFWDYGCEVPLWGDWGNLSGDPEWLARELGLSQALIADLLAYAEAQELHPTVEGDDEDRLFRRIQDELAEGLTVVRGT